MLLPRPSPHFFFVPVGSTAFAVAAIKRRPPFVSSIRQRRQPFSVGAAADTKDSKRRFRRRRFFLYKNGGSGTATHLSGDAFLAGQFILATFSPRSVLLSLSKIMVSSSERIRSTNFGRRIRCQQIDSGSGALSNFQILTGRQSPPPLAVR